MDGTEPVPFRSIVWAGRKENVARDDFVRADIDRMAKRVGMKCSYPDCRAPTSGPDAAGGVTNIGVRPTSQRHLPGVLGTILRLRRRPEVRSATASGCVRFTPSLLMTTNSPIPLICYVTGRQRPSRWPLSRREASRCNVQLRFPI
jgi:hypothetical protein